MKVTVEQIAPERAEEVLLRCHDPKEPWVEEIQSIAAGQITLHAILLEVVLLPLAHNWGFWYNTLDGLIYATFILAAKVMWHLIDFGQSFYMAAALNEQIRKRKREEIQEEGTNNG